MRYIGKTCVKCGKIFTENDDIVVCPKCGSPHHRECYNEENKCANESHHNEGYKWLPKLEKVSEENTSDEVVKDSSCGATMSEDSEACPTCNEPNEEQQFKKSEHDNQIENGFQSVFGISTDYDMNGVSALELFYFIKVNVFYYLMYFKQIVLSKRKLSINLFCFFLPSVYFANRRMWLWAIISALINAILTVPYAIVTLANMSINLTGAQYFSDSVVKVIADNSEMLNSIINVCSGLDFVVRLIFCLFANMLYFRFAVNSIKKVKKRTGAKSDMDVALVNVGGLKILNTPLMILIKVAMTLMSVYLSIEALEIIF